MLYPFLYVPVKRSFIIHNGRLERKHDKKVSMMRLEIYIGAHCFNCDEAMAIAEAAQTIAGLDVSIVDVDDPASDPSMRIVAVPTYVLDGHIIALGNPERQSFLSHLQSIQEFTT